MDERGHYPLQTTLAELREKLEHGFSPETAAAGFRGTGSATGQCAATTVIAREVLGGEFASASIDRQSHWFNRLHIDGSRLDVDLTGDQFGYPAVQVAAAGRLYSGSRLRHPEEVTAETLRRAVKLSRQAGMPEIASRLEGWLARVDSSE